jgi:hypothetical protein
MQTHILGLLLLCRPTLQTPSYIADIPCRHDITTEACRHVLCRRNLTMQTTIRLCRRRPYIHPYDADTNYADTPTMQAGIYHAVTHTMQTPTMQTPTTQKHTMTNEPKYATHMHQPQAAVIAPSNVKLLELPSVPA